VQAATESRGTGVDMSRDRGTGGTVEKAKAADVKSSSTSSSSSVAVAESGSVRGVDTQTVHGARGGGREEGGGKSVASDHVGGGAHAGDGRETVDSRVELSWADVGLGEEAERKRAAEMARLAALQELLAANNEDAAQEKQDEIIRAAEADGHIDEVEQRLIDDARSKLQAHAELKRKQRAQASGVGGVEGGGQGDVGGRPEAVRALDSRFVIIEKMLRDDPPADTRGTSRAGSGKGSGKRRLLGAHAPNAVDSQGRGHGAKDDGKCKALGDHDAPAAREFAARKQWKVEEVASCIEAFPKYCDVSCVESACECQWHLLSSTTRTSSPGTFQRKLFSLYIGNYSLFT
jgi:hypothetical protein